jgi:ribonuclease HII
MKYIIGIDEVGRGPLAGPVTVGFVMCKKEVYKSLSRSRRLPPKGFDSKKLTASERKKYSENISLFTKAAIVNSGVVHISSKIIDKKGIAVAIKMAVKKIFDGLEVSNKEVSVLLDGGLKAPVEFPAQKTIIRGDEKEKIIAWASIVAKVARDEIMAKAHKKFPEYGFVEHKGYGTLYHRKAIAKHGLCPLHRRSFCANLVLDEKPVS